jgi:hypothetical protein
MILGQPLLQFLFTWLLIIFLAVVISLLPFVIRRFRPQAQIVTGLEHLCYTLRITVLIRYATPPALADGTPHQGDWHGSTNTVST